MLRILFVCIHNSARSQMAEAFANKFGNGKILAESAGIEPGKLNPVVVSVMKEIGIDISSKRTNSVQDFIDQGRKYDYVVTVCDEASAERCPVFSGFGKRVHFGFKDPSKLNGNDQEKLKLTRPIRDSIKEKIESWINSLIE